MADPPACKAFQNRRHKLQVASSHAGVKTTTTGLCPHGNIPQEPASTALERAARVMGTIKHPAKEAGISTPL
jgi:hypothetical protein